MNILYRGLPNDVRITDPEIQNNNLRVSSRGARTKGIGNNTWEVALNSLNDLQLVISDVSNQVFGKRKLSELRIFLKWKAIISEGRTILASKK